MKFKFSKNNLFVPQKKALPIFSKETDIASQWLAEKALLASEDSDRRFILFADYDCDGASSASILRLNMSLLGVKDYIPVLSNRLHGYGLTEKSLSIIQEARKGSIFGITKIPFSDLPSLEEGLLGTLPKDFYDIEVEKEFNRDFEDEETLAVIDEKLQTDLNFRPEPNSWTLAYFYPIKREKAPEKTTVVMMDLGINQMATVEELLKENYQVMVIDHHLVEAASKKEWKRLEEIYGKENLCVYDPYLRTENDIDYQFKCLCAAALTFKICAGITDKEKNLLGFRDKILSQPDLMFDLEKNEYLEGYEVKSIPVHLNVIVNTSAKICAIALAADCMPFVDKDGGLNAAWEMSKRFEKITEHLLPGLKMLNTLTNTASRIPWVLSPIINAAGRIFRADSSLKLLTTPSQEEAEKILSKINKQRNEVRRQTKNASMNLDRDRKTSKGLCVLLGDPKDIEEGVLGIAAARAAEKYLSPALFLGPAHSEKYGQIYKGSMRAGETDFSCEKFIAAAKEHDLLWAGGGHVKAAGVTVKVDKLKEFLALAETMTFERDFVTIKVVNNLKDIKAYEKSVGFSFPFGQNHRSEVISFTGKVIKVQALTTNKNMNGTISEDRRTWAYQLLLQDHEGNDLEVKIKEQDCQDDQKLILDELALRGADNYIEVKMIVEDQYKLESNYDRSSLSVYLAKTIGENDELEERASFQLLTAEVYEELIKGNIDPTDRLEMGLVKIENARMPLKVEYDNGIFILTPPPFGIKDQWGDGYQQFMNQHKGRWSKEKRAYLVTKDNALRMMKADGGEKWYYLFSEKAKNELT